MRLRLEMLGHHVVKRFSARRTSSAPSPVLQCAESPKLLTQPPNEFAAAIIVACPSSYPMPQRPFAIHGPAKTADRLCSCAVRRVTAAPLTCFSSPAGYHRMGDQKKRVLAIDGIPPAHDGRCCGEFRPPGWRAPSQLGDECRADVQKGAPAIASTRFFLVSY